MDLRSPTHSSPQLPTLADTTAPWPPMPPEDPTSFRWLQPGELLAIPVPTAALQLDALLRHLDIDAEFQDWPSATIHLAQARGTWQRLEPALMRRAEARSYLKGARKAAREMARALDRAADAVRECDRNLTMRLSKAAIGQIEVIERVFE